MKRNTGERRADRRDKIHECQIRLRLLSEKRRNLVDTNSAYKEYLVSSTAGMQHL
jgi:hypothetical protein